MSHTLPTSSCADLVVADASMEDNELLKSVLDTEGDNIEHDPLYSDLERQLGLSSELKQYFSLLWSEGFTNVELLLEITVEDLKELSIIPCKST